MLFTAFILVMKLASAPYMRITEDQTHPIMYAARNVAIDNDPLPFKGLDEDEKRTRTMSTLIVFTAYESGGKTTALGDCEDPSKRTVETCRSIGAMQINQNWLHHEALEKYAMTPKQFLAAPLETQMQMSLDVMRWLSLFCRSVRKGAYAYASGSCVPPGSAKAKVDQRCELIGGC